MKFAIIGTGVMGCGWITQCTMTGHEVHCFDSNTESVTKAKETCQRLAVKGGITGLWQVSGRSDLTFDEQCLLDIYYIENWSLLFDIRILIQTIPFTLFGRGAY